MLLPSSTEFIALCHAQVSLLSQNLGASWTAIYLAEELLGVEALGQPSAADRFESWHFLTNLSANFIPVVIYPDSVYETAAANWRESGQRRQLPGGSEDSATTPDMTRSMTASSLPYPAVPLSYSSFYPEVQAVANRPQPVIVPLVHEGMVLGMLVTGRDDRTWSEWEQGQIEPIACTLGLACILDQRSQWLKQQHHQQEILQERQHDLLDNLLHQFRNPLTALRTFGKLLLRRLLAEDPNREVANSIVAESNRLQELLQQFDQAIDLSLPTLPPLLTSASPSLPPPTLGLEGQIVTQPCSLLSILQPLLNSVAAIAQERQLHLHTLLPDTLGMIQADPSTLREVLSNLLDNALKYTPRGGHIVLQVQDDFSYPGMARELRDLVVGSRDNSPSAYQTILISDTGPGIPVEDQEHLFERRYRGVQAKGDIPGTGLGLAIARDLMTQIQGHIQVFSPALPGLLPTDVTGWVRDSPGTTFMVQLPRWLGVGT